MKQVTQALTPEMYPLGCNKMTIIEQCCYGDGSYSFYCYGDPALVENRIGGEYTVAVFKVKPKA